MSELDEQYPDWMQTEEAKTMYAELQERHPNYDSGRLWQMVFMRLQPLGGE